MFIHLESIDQAGHTHSWGSQQYYDAVKIVDGYIGEIMDAYVKADIFDLTLFIIVSDHGGYGLDHKKFDEVCIRIPILAMGPRVRKGHTITGYSSNVDVAPTVLHALGLQPGQFMVGKILEEVFFNS
ncbi:Arylsulfatase K [Geodia barretti]|uniref:Arylsulfatase K n=1 Tax=Geodia barretti TaxID=519541 RepID=A0AA35X1A8_GEOBA|nr:Arylsulfatase K [Geodia barretti]